MRRHRANLIFAVLALSVAGTGDAIGAGEILPAGEGCAAEAPLSCLNTDFSDLQADTVPLNLDSGIWYPALGGIFTTMERRRRAEAGEEVALSTLAGDDLRSLAEDDPKTAFRVLSADPSARHLLLGLDLLAREVLAREPREAPADYVFLGKIVESTLYASATEREDAIYVAAEQFRNCVQITLIDDKTARLTERCLPGLQAAAEPYWTGTSPQ